MLLREQHRRIRAGGRADVSVSRKADEEVDRGIHHWCAISQPDCFEDGVKQISVCLYVCVCVFTIIESCIQAV